MRTTRCGRRRTRSDGLLPTGTLPDGMTGSDDGNLRRVLGLGLAVAVLLGAAAAGGSIVRSTSTEATAGQAFPYALMGALSGAVLAGIVIVGVRAAKPGTLRLRPAELLAVVFIAAAVGALLGAALTPRTPAPEEVSPLDEEAIEDRIEEGRTLDGDTRTGPIDLDGDGQPDVDSNGDVIVAYDRDGDGIFDGVLQPCPPGTPQPPSRPGLTPIDFECDGIVDEWLPFDPSSFLAGDEFLEEPLPTIPPEERAERAEEAGAAGQQNRVLLTLLLVLAAIAVCAAIIVWLVRMPDRGDADGDQDGEGDGDQDGEGDGEPPIDLAPSFEASLDAMLDDVDPRQAICAAYGSLLDGFAAAGLPRRAEEAPEEHARRCLAAAAMDPRPVRELLELFALARFSSHPVDEQHRIAAVRAMRAALASAGTAARQPVGAGSAAMSGPDRWSPPGAPA
jgi:hypothetical protein